LPEFKRLDPEDDTQFAEVDMPFLSQILQEERDRKLIADDDLRRIDWLIVLIATNAIINQKHRNQHQRDGKWVLEADVKDYNEVLDVFNSCVLSDRAPVGKAEQGAFIKLIPTLCKDSMTSKEIELALKKSERTIRSYLSSWRATGLVQSHVDFSVNKYNLGPAIQNELKAAHPSEPSVYRDENYVERAARTLFGKSTGFTPQPLKNYKVTTCTCELHICRTDKDQALVGLQGMQRPDCTPPA